MSFLNIFAFLVFLISLCTMLQAFWGSLKMQHLEKTSPGTCTHTPLVSIIVPACNEETTLEPALRSLLQQEYSNLEIIVIDDRSTDTTFERITKLAQEFPRIQVEQVKELPMGWLGKNHALYLGAQRARGEILLFTDADIVMRASTLSRAVAYFVNENLDHLSLIFRNLTPGGLLNAMVIDSLGSLFLLFGNTLSHCLHSNKSCLDNSQKPGYQLAWNTLFPGRIKKRGAAVHSFFQALKLERGPWKH